MAATGPRKWTVNSEVLERIAGRFEPVPPNGLGLPEDPDTIQLRIGTLAAGTNWAEISELLGVPEAKGDPEGINVAFPAIQEAVRRRHDLARRLMIRVWEEPGLSDRLMDRVRPGSLRRVRSDWLVWGEGAGRWREEP
ncbi:MAG: hypothetical protein QG622_792 [Actinomycetota bacterium]|nr:hypothetical protein [Actinomycetota bacterium]